MAVDIITLYKDAQLTQALSKGDMSAPLEAYINGEVGGTFEMKLYAKNTSSEYAITNHTISIYDTDTSTPIPNGITIKFAKSDANGLLDESTLNDTLTTDDIPPGGYVDFLIRITVAAGTSIQKITDLKIRNEGEAYIP